MAGKAKGLWPGGENVQRTGLRDTGKEPQRSLGDAPGKGETVGTRGVRERGHGARKVKEAPLGK